MSLPITNFTATPLSGYAPLSVLFNDTSIIDEALISRLWTFGDGSTATVENIYHTYNHPGKYTITLIVTTASGSDTETRVLYISVLAALGTLNTLDVAPSESLPLLRNMSAVGDGKQSTIFKGIKYYKENSANTNGSGFKRPNGPLLTFD